MRTMLSESILYHGKYPNWKTHESAYFLVGHFASSKIESESSFPKKYYIITILKKNVAFWPIFTKVKKWIFH